jgi:GNAT superfamily N-acetyltransferase
MMRSNANMAIEIRTATLDDINNLVNRRADFFREIKGLEMSSEQREATIEYLKGNINSDSLVCYIALENNTIISMVILCVYKVLPKLYNITGVIGYIYNVFTVKSYRGRGLAEELLKSIIEEAKKREIKELYLNAEEKAMPLYKRIGFKNIDREMVLFL